MYEVNSQAISEDYKAESTPLKEWKFQIENGNLGELIISDALLDTEALAYEKAKAEFLKNSYRLNEVTFNTYRTDLYQNMTINLYGIPYLIKSLNTTIDETSIQTKVKAVRYE